MLKDILAISGQPGLFKLVSSTKNGIIVENLETGKRMPAYAASKVIALSDIAIYTLEGEDNPLINVLRSIRDKENSGPAIDAKIENAKLKSYFETIMPEYDKDRVYVSDIKKVVTWYNILQKLDQLHLLNEEPEQNQESTEKEN